MVSIHGFNRPTFPGTFKGQVNGIRKYKKRTGQRLFLTDPKTGKKFLYWVKVKVEEPVWVWDGHMWISFEHDQEVQKSKPSREEFLKKKKELAAQGIRFK